MAEALNWLFRCHRCPPGAILTGVPPLARADLGQTPWERRLVEKIRVRHLAWRTEPAYRGWAWRLVEFLGQRPVESATAALPNGCADALPASPISCV